MDNLSETRLIEAIRQLQSLYMPRLPNEFFGSLTFDDTENDEFHEFQKESRENYRRIQLQVETAQQHLLGVAKKSGFDVPSAWLSVRYNSVIESVKYHREGDNPDGQLIRTINRTGPDCVALKAVREDMRIAQMRLTASLGSTPSGNPQQKPQTTGDKKRDKKILSPRGLTPKARSCARIYKFKRKADPKTTMKTVITEYIEEHGGSFDSIKKSLSDNPNEWKPDAKRDK